MKLAVVVALVTAQAGSAAAQSLACPVVSSDANFASTTMSTDCDGISVTQGCTSKSGVTWDQGAGLLRLPGSGGNFQPPPAGTVPENVFFGAPADFDRDGWDDFMAADQHDRIYMMRNQTVTCGTTDCTFNTPQTISSTWWDTLTNVRPLRFRTQTSTTGTKIALKPSVGGDFMSSMVAGDYNGDGWPDVAVISSTHRPAKDAWPTAARLFLNTQNCRSSAAPTRPCGIGSLCTGQALNGACPAGYTQGAFTETQLSCTSDMTCPDYMPTFATYDLRTGDAVDNTNNVSTNAAKAATYFPGDFGPMRHSVQNIATVDWDGDGDLDILYGHSTGTCKGTGSTRLCELEGRQFYTGISVWLNSCAQSAQWDASTKSCIGHIPRFTRPFPSTGCSGTDCNDPAILIPSTAHNNTTLAPSAKLGFDHTNTESVSFAYVDIDKDNDFDLVIGSPGCCTDSNNAGNRLRVFRGLSNSKTVHTLDTASPISLSSKNSTYPGFEGALTGVFVHDFSLDGWPDIITGSDGAAYSSSLGGRTRYWKNTADASRPYGANWPTCSSNPAACTNCSSTCNPSPTLKLSESCGSTSCKVPTASPPQFGDFDMGFMLDYDRDPDRTLDMVLTNGNDTNEAYIFPNRSTPSRIAACGEVASGTLPMPTSELTVNGACITPSATVPTDTSITYYLTNENPANYQLACKQTSAGFTPALTGGACCVTFAKPTGRAISWKAVFDANSSDDETSNPCSLTGTETPRLNSVTSNFTYTPAGQHYRAGVVVYDGVSYVGSFTEPGDRGHMYALAAGDGSQYYDVATKLDAQANRTVYTTAEVGSSVTRIPFSPASPAAALISRVGAADATNATSVINWILSARFGVGNAGISPSKLGAVMNSTPAVLGPPYRPNWYAYLPPGDKTLYDTFATTNANRVPLVLFGAMDGMIHAIISSATDINNTRNGTEAWAFVPPYVASAMTSDYNATQVEGKTVVTSYPDGSPSLFDYRKSNGSIATIALITDGGGGSSVTALDVTQTIDTSFSVSGPTPLWSHVPGDSTAGKALVKPGLARVLLNGQEVYIVVAGSGIHSVDDSKGRTIVGYNLETGAELWKFETHCAATSDILMFETDDIGTYEPGAPVLDGYTDRAVFADRCGYVYKINPAQDLGGGWMANTGMGPIDLGESNGVHRYALFSTTQTGALGAGQERPIVGTIGAKTDSTTDLVLFFGTGGLESYDDTKQNEFYAVYAKNGTIRHKVTGSCTAGRCEKFYGGVVLATEDVIIQRSTDPLIGGNSCDFGSSSVQALNANTFNTVFNLTSVDGVPIAASTGPLYGDAGALYFATVSGEIKRVGSPRATSAGQDTASGAIHSMSTGSIGGGANPLTLLGWRVVL
ncbi:MAG: PilC/PilY family type IV pilus protein [Kofleriaceae bacterium]|nr:PilC/PilY family type IV pilus protein [Kofleriaceae bacterium]